MRLIIYIKLTIVAAATLTFTSCHNLWKRKLSNSLYLYPSANYFDTSVFCVYECPYTLNIKRVYHEQLFKSLVIIKYRRNAYLLTSL